MRFLPKLFLTLALALSACSKKEDLDKAVVKVPTSICGECVKTISKAVLKVDGVRSVNVDTDTKLATIEFIPTVKIGDIEQAIVHSGYDANDKKRDPEAYENLPDCCKK